jgi:hypothetical protein
VWFDDVLKLVMAGSIRKKSSRVVGKFSRKVKLATDFHHRRTASSALSA